MLQWWAAAGVVLGVLVTGLVLAGMVGRPLRRLAKQNDEFRLDWYGMPARPGRDAIPGVPERLSRIEDRFTTDLARVETRLDDHIRTHGGPKP